MYICISYLYKCASKYCTLGVRITCSMTSHHSGLDCGTCTCCSCVQRTRIDCGPWQSTMVENGSRGWTRIAHICWSWICFQWVPYACTVEHSYNKLLYNKFLDITKQWPQPCATVPHGKLFWYNKFLLTTNSLTRNFWFVIWVFLCMYVPSYRSWVSVMSSNGHCWCYNVFNCSHGHTCRMWVCKAQHVLYLLMSPTLLHQLRMSAEIQLRHLE